MSFLLNWFLPHHGNNHKANLIKSSSLLLLSFVFVFFQVFLNFFLMARPSVLGYSSNITPEEIIELTNTERTKLGLGVLKENKLLSEAARQKASDMFSFNYWSHVSPSGRTPWAFFSDAGYKYQYAGENLARDFKEPVSVVRAWMNSSSHRDNIVNSKYQEIGVVVVDGTLQGVETTLVIQLFGTQYGSVPAKPASKPDAEKETVVVEEKQLAQQPVKTAKEVLSKGAQGKVITSPLDLSKGMVILIVGVLIGVFLADWLIISREQHPRFSSKSLAQMMFLLFVLLASLLMKQGAIL